MRSDLAPAAKAVLLYLASHADGFLVHNDRAASDLGMSVNTYLKHLKAAVVAGYVAVIRSSDQDRYGNKIRDLRITLSKPDSVDSAVDSDRYQEVSTKKIIQEDQSFLSRRIAPQSTAIPLPDDWQPNHSHRVAAADNGLDLQELIEEFRATWAAQNETRMDWDKTFGGFIRDFISGPYWATA